MEKYLSSDSNTMEWAFYTKISHDWTCPECHTELVPSGYPREMKGE